VLLELGRLKTDSGSKACKGDDKEGWIQSLSWLTSRSMNSG